MNNPVPVLPNKVYDFLSWLAQIVLPALATLYLALGLPSAKEVSGALIAVDAFLGAILNLSSKAYNASDERFDGEVLVSGKGDEKDARLVFNDHPADMADKKGELTFKVKHVSPAKKTAKRVTKAAKNVKVEEKA